MEIGSVLHDLRKEKGMTLAELADKSGVALATLSRMENGKMTGTLESHMKICEALGITLPDLYKDLAPSKKTVEVKTGKSHSDVFVHNKKSSSEMLAANALNKKMLPVLIKLQRGGATHKEETKPGIEKFIYILEGKIEAVIGNEKHNLIKGDTLYFNSSIPHHFRNLATGETVLISVMSPPAV
ncbi:MAG: XRE family transcriptional regulator [Candidatus Omnitrophica bacterium]|nr:XRE family transcriptional regulator [Candidatus Omnitrophota bacterium]